MNVKELLEKLENLRAELKELKGGERTLDNAAKITELRAQITATQSEHDEAVKQEAEVAAAFEDADVDAPAATSTDPDKQEPGKTAEEVNKDNPAPVPATPSPVVPAEDAPADKDKPAEDAVTAPAVLAASGADVSPTAAADAAAADVAPMVLTASGASVSGGVAAGSALDRDGLGKVLTAAASGASSLAGRTRILEMQRFGDVSQDEVAGRHNTEIANTRIIAKARAAFMQGGNNRPAALTAAGCFCGPDELIRQTGVVGRRGRPFAGMFPTIPISGGFRAMPDLAFNVDTGLRSGVTQWTCADQTAVDANDPDTWKPCAELACFTEQTYVPYAVSACITAERFHQWAHPEQIDAWVNLLGIEYDSLAETLLIDQIEAEAGTPLTIGAAGGLMEDFALHAKLLYALSSMAYPLGYQFREGAGVLEGYTLSVPVGMAEALYADEKLRGFPSGLDSKEAVVASIERGTGVRMVERLDESTSRKAAAAATVTALNAGGAIDANDTPLLPPTFRLYLIPLDGYVHGEGSIVTADWHVDDALLRQNRMRYFWENVEILANLSVRKPHIIDVPGVIAGSYTDLVAPPIPV